MALRAFLAVYFFQCASTLMLLADPLQLQVATRDELEAKERPYVTCWLGTGQLGNQLFVVASTLAFAWDHDMDALFPDLNCLCLNIPINKARIFFRLDSSPLPRPIEHTFIHGNNFVKVDIPVIGDQYLWGYYQTWKYFDHHRERIQRMFAPKPEDEIFIKEKYDTLLSHPLTVGLHVRTFNKAWGTTILPFVGLDYYKKAMQLFPPETQFVVFSDRINWCRHHFRQLNGTFIFIDSKDYIEDFFLMSMLKHNIIGNSTYSWWAAYLNKNPNKIIVAPSDFTNMPREMSNPNMPDWHVIEIDLNYAINHYPEDMKDYDEYSQSIDTQ